MAFDSDTRNKLARMIAQSRGMLVVEFTQQLQEIYGIQPDGTITPIEKLTHLDDEQASTAKLLRERIEHLASGMETDKESVVTAINRTIHEQAFTILNRFAALRMSEERGFVKECVRKGMQSQGFKVYETVAGASLGDTFERYKTFVFCLFDEIAVDLGVLFDRFSPYGLLFPREQALQELLEIIHNGDHEHIWTEDETIGWIYQYFNSKKERETMRKASSAPRNSRELAVRNQFFTPRYVVEFLTDNTLGQIWYEMRAGKTLLTEQCRYLIRRPNEIFLESGQKAPASEELEEDLSQEELLKRTVYIEHRLKKDPRDFKILDPACGSGHFLLYCFDLLETIYEEAYEDPELGPDLKKTYSTPESLKRNLPGLILRHNLHGIDIDPRAVHIAALALWLRAQQSYLRMELKPAERPRITKTNLVCAEPMPGEADMLQEFTATLTPRVLGQIVEFIFEKMTLAGEAGSLLKIEEEIKDAVNEAKKQWLEGPKPDQQLLFPGEANSQLKQQELHFDLKGITGEWFWEQAEDRILDALKDYAKRAENGNTMRRRLFAEDAARGFAFIDLCRKSYDVVLMNPPFGAASRKTKRWMRVTYPLSGENILIAFLCRGLNLISNLGLMGCIADRSWLQKYDYRKFRAWVIKERCLSNVVDLGWEVLDTANVETAVSIFAKDNRNEIIFGNDSLRESFERLLFPFASLFVRTPEFFNVIPNDSYAYAIHPTVYSWFARSCKVNEKLITFQGGINSGNAFQTNRYHWEVSPHDIGLKSRWVLFQAGSPYSPFYYPTLMVSFCEQGSFKTLLSHPNARVPGIEYYGRPGITYGKRTDSMYSYAMPAGGAFSWEGQAGFVPNDSKVGLYQALGFTNSSTYITLSNLVAGQHKYAGYLNTICCDISPLPALATESERIVEDLLSLDIANELSLRFVSISSSEVFDLSCHSQDRARIEDALTKSIRSQHRHLSRMVAEALGVRSIFGNPPNFDPVKVLFGSTFSNSLVLHSTLSYMIGCAYGRWDIRFATGEKAAPELPDPFLPLPVCPPGQLQNEKGLPFTENDVRSLKAVGQWHYPIDILWKGILVDDPGITGGQPDRVDIVCRVREVFDLLWKDKAHEIEQEACDILGVSDLRDYFRRPSGFFQDHLKRYSKSRRKAPIYWPLSTASGSYTIWLYYHRLTDQTLYACVNDYVNPKLDNVSKDIERLQEEISKQATAQKRQQLEKLIDFAQELKDFREELLRVAALPYKPNLNDGVLITAAPLWKLFRHNQWRKDLETCWKKLEAGKHDWAHLAYTVWSDRVKAKCKTDLSIANAQDLENLYEGDITKHKKRRKKAKG